MRLALVPLLGRFYVPGLNEEGYGARRRGPSAACRRMVRRHLCELWLTTRAS